MEKLESIIVSNIEPKLKKGIVWFNPSAGRKLQYYGSRGWETMAEQAEPFNINDYLGKPNGIASLDNGGKVPSSQLPSYVDDVLEYDNFDSLPPTGEKGKIYVTTDDDKTYRWSGTQYIEISNPLNANDIDILQALNTYGVLIPSTPAFKSYFLAQGNEAGLYIPQYKNGTYTPMSISIPLATESRAGLMSLEDKSKLELLSKGTTRLLGGLTAGGSPEIIRIEDRNAYVLRIAYSTLDLRTLEKSTNSTEIPGATLIEAGLMSASDKSRLESLYNNYGNGSLDAFVKNIYNDGALSSNNSPIINIEGDDAKIEFKYRYSTAPSQTKSVTIPLATNTSAGLMSLDDKSKLDSIDDINEKIDNIENDIYDTADLVAGDIILANNETEKLTYCKSEELEQYVDTHTPIGVVVVPTNHDIYETKEAGVISLVNMSCNTPEIGTLEDEKMYSSGRVEDISLLARDTLAGYSLSGVETTADSVAFYNHGGIASDRVGPNEGTSYPKNSNLRYHPDFNNDLGSSNCKAVGPYQENWEKNPDYWTTVISSNKNNNAFAVNKGYEIAKAICEKSSSYDDSWKTSPTVQNANSRSFDPVSCCCQRYHTKGTNQGDWYSPTICEWGYITARIQLISQSLKEIKKYYNNVVDITDRGYWTSTITSSGKYAVSTEDYYIPLRWYTSSNDTGVINEQKIARAFTRIKVLGDKVKFYTKEEINSEIKALKKQIEDLYRIVTPE